MSRLEDLRELREQLLVWVVDAPIDRKAALVAQLRATVEDIEKLAPPEKSGDVVDEIAKRRAARRPAAAKAAGRAKRSG